MAHLPGQQFVRFFGLLALGNVDKIPNMTRSSMSASSPWPRAEIHRMSPPDKIEKINLVRAYDGPRSSKSGIYAFQIGRVDVLQKNFETDFRFALRYFPELICAFVHGDGVGIDIPGP